MQPVIVVCRDDDDVVAKAWEYIDAAENAAISSLPLQQKTKQ